MKIDMKIQHSPTSPFVRKCLVTAHELDMFDRIEKVASAAHPVNRSAPLVELNPLGQVPTLVTDDGTVLYDSRVICEYLNENAQGDLLPREGTERWRVLTEAALADGLMAAALLARYETALRPAASRWEPWLEGQMAKASSTLQWLDAAPQDRLEAVDLATIGFACGLSYLDFRFPSFDWRTRWPRAAQWFETFSRRPSMRATEFKA